MRRRWPMSSTMPGPKASVSMVGINIGQKIPVELGKIQIKNLTVRGCIGSPGVWPAAIRFLERTGIDLSPIQTHSFALDRCDRGFRTGQEPDKGGEDHAGNRLTLGGAGKGGAKMRSTADSRPDRHAALTAQPAEPDARIRDGRDFDHRADRRLRAVFAPSSHVGGRAVGQPALCGDHRHRRAWADAGRAAGRVRPVAAGRCVAGGGDRHALCRRQTTRSCSRRLPWRLACAVVAGAGERHSGRRAAAECHHRHDRDERAALWRRCSPFRAACRASRRSCWPRSPAARSLASDIPSCFAVAIMLAWSASC